MTSQTAPAASSSAPAVDRGIVFSGVSKVYAGPGGAVTALSGVDLVLRPATLTMVLGPSGSGKSTLLHLMGGLDRATTGSLVVAGVELAEARRRDLNAFRRRSVSFVFQSFNLFPALTALENVELGAALADRAGARALAVEALESVGLAPRARHFPGQMSGGEQQRVSVARALASANPVILADEPTGELDAENGKVVLSLLRAAADRGHTVVVVTHNREMAPAADRVITMASGRIADDTAAPGRPVPVSELRW